MLANASCIHRNLCPVSTIGGSSLKSRKLLLQARGLFLFKNHCFRNVISAWGHCRFNLTGTSRLLSALQEKLYQEILQFLVLESNLYHVFLPQMKNQTAWNQSCHRERVLHVNWTGNISCWHLAPHIISNTLRRPFPPVSQSFSWKGGSVED